MFAQRPERTYGSYTYVLPHRPTPASGLRIMFILYSNLRYILWFENNMLVARAASNASMAAFPRLFIIIWLMAQGARLAPDILLNDHDPQLTTDHLFTHVDNEMAIAPITGKLRKRFWLDVSLALGTGIAAGYTFW